MYTSTKDTYFSNQGASILFINETYEPRNEAELELLEKMYKEGKVGKTAEPIKIEVKNVEEIKEEVEEPKEIEVTETNSDIELARQLYFEKYQKECPSNKKNDIEWINSKL